MKILLTSPYPLIPPDSGGAVRTVNIAQALQRMGHKVHILGARKNHDARLDTAVEVHSFKPSGTLGHFINLDFSRILNELLDQKFDLIVAGFPFQSRMIMRLAKKHKVPVIYDAHNVEADRFKRMGQPWVASLVRNTEKYICKSAENVMAVSEEDRNLLWNMYGVNALLLPNGVDTATIRPGPPADEELAAHGLTSGNYVLFFGGYDYPPNQEAARFLLQDIWPKIHKNVPNMKLALVGRHPHRWMEGPNVVVTGGVADLLSYIRGARVVVAPLFSGGGTRLKITEALSCGKDILATPFGAMGIAANDSPALRLAEPLDFHERLLDLLQTQPQEVCGNREARALASNFDWYALVSRVINEIEALTH